MAPHHPVPALHARHGHFFAQQRAGAAGTHEGLERTGVVAAHHHVGRQPLLLEQAAQHLVHM
jgi:hypothetical protein